MNATLFNLEKTLGKTFEELYNENEKYIYITINKYYFKYKKTMWSEDIEQCARIGLVNAINSLDINRLDSFINHIITCIRKEVLYFENAVFGAKGYSRREENDKGIESLNRIVNNDNNKSGELLDMVAATLDIEEDIVKRIDLYNAIKTLTESEKQIIDYLLKSKSQKEIASKVGVSEATITQRLKKIYNKLRNVI